MDTVIISPTLEVVNMTYAQEQYGDFVDILNPLLSISDFKQKRNLPLNEQCSSVFYAKTAHLKDIDYVEIDRPILEMIGFKNIISSKKDKNGNINLDSKGNPILRDTRSDFNSAIRCLRNTVGFIEGSSFDDLHAHFVVQKAAQLKGCAANSNGGAGLNKQSIWIRMRALEHFVIMANTCNSFMIREYFLDLKRIMTEYNIYQTVYRSKYDLCLKDTTIGALRNDIHVLIEKSDHQSQQLEMQSQQMQVQSQQLDVQSQQLKIQSQKMEMLSNILLKETDDKVVDVKDKLKKQELVILQHKTEPTRLEVLRGQLNHVNQVKRKRNDMEVVGKIDSYKNPINLFNRFNESIKKENDDRFQKSNNKIVLKNGSTVQDFMHVLHNLDEDKHSVANNVKNCL